MTTAFSCKMPRQAANDAREHEQLHRAGQVLDRCEGHQHVGFGGHDLVPDDGAEDRDHLVVQVAGLLFVRKARQRGGGDPGDQRAVGVQRVAGQVQARDLLFHLEQFGGRILRQGRDLVILGRLRAAPAGQRGKQVELAFQVLARVGLDAFQDRLHALQHAVAAWVPGRRTRRRGSGFPARGG